MKQERNMGMVFAITAVIVIISILAVYFFLSRKSRQTRPFSINVETTQETAMAMSEGIRTEKALKDCFDKAGLSKHWEYLRSGLSNEIITEVSSAPETELKIGQSKMGGQPDLPKGTHWFKEDNGKRLSFIAQINLGEVSSFDKSQTLPSKGMLYFFYSATQDAWGFDPKDKDKFKVYYFEGNTSDLIRQNFPGDLAKVARYKPCKLKFKSSVSLPGWEHEFVSQRLNDDELNKYTEATEELDLNVEANKLLGHSENIQAPMELECQLVTNGLYCGDPSGYDDPRAKQLEKGRNDWVLLFQVASNDECGMMWGDAGYLYFWIKKEDLKNKSFDRSWLILQCT